MTDKRLHIIIRCIAIAAACAAVIYAIALSYRAPYRAARTAALPPITIDPNILTAKAAVIYDPTTDTVLFSKNDEAQLALASLTKLMTARTALDRMSATTTVHITKEAILTEGDSGLRAGESWRMGELIKYALTVSSNDAMAAVAQSGGGKAFIADMNETAGSLGLAQSYFLDPTGLDVTGSTSGAYGSARDVAFLATDVYRKYPDIFESTLQTQETYRAQDGTAVSGTPTAARILDIPGLIGAKTGYTTLAGGNLVTVFDSALGHPLVGVVLGSTEEGRFEDMRTLIGAARAVVK